MRTTITLPDSLVTQVDNLIPIGDIKSRNQFIVEALEEKVKQIRNQQIDAEFKLMEKDTDYIEETLAIEAEFASADAETFKIAEK